MSVATLTPLKARKNSIQAIANYYFEGDLGLRPDVTENASPASSAQSGLDDYFIRTTERNGLWLGGGAAVLGLTDKVMTAEDFGSILNGHNPTTGVYLPDERQARTDRNLGFDFTIGFDKSVSIVYAIANLETKRRITAAAERAVRGAFDEFVAEGVFRARCGTGGKTKMATNDLVASMFTHVTNRAQEPQLHVHLNIANITFCADGKWRALDMREAHNRQREFAYAVDIRMSNEIRKLGFGLHATENKSGLKIAGLSEEVIAEFSSRRLDILDAVKASGRALNAKNQNIAALATRKQKKVTDLVQLDQSWRAKLLQFSLASMADIQRNSAHDPSMVNQAKRNPVPSDLLQSITGGRAVAHSRDISRAVKKAVLRKINDAEDVFSEAQIRAMIADMTRQVFALTDLEPIATLAAEVGLPAKKNTDEFYASRELFDIELEIKTACAQGVGSPYEGLPTEDVERAIAAVERRTGFKLNAEQQDAARRLCNDKWVSVMIGAAGAGKSTSAEAVRLAYEYAGKRVLGAAPSTKAAIALMAGSGIKSRTTTKLLLAVGEGDIRLGKNDVIVVDEAGMLSTFELYRFYQLARDTGAKLILMGDDHQLEPIPTPCMLSEISSEVSKSELIDIRRQQDPELGVAVMKLFSGGRIPPEMQNQFIAFYKNKLIEKECSAEEAEAQATALSTTSAFEDFKRRDMIVETDHQTLLMASVVNDFLSNVEKSANNDWSKVSAWHLAGSIMLASTNQDVSELNSVARQALMELGVLDPSQSVEVETVINGRVAPKVFCRGDRLMLRDRDPSGEGAFSNGMAGSITGIKGAIARVDLDEGGIIAIDLNEFKALDHAYALTVSQSQGMTVDNTSLLSRHRDGNRVIYVGMSRFRYSGKIFTDDLERLECQFENVEIKRNAVGYIEGLSGSMDKNTQQLVKRYLSRKARAVKLESVRDAVQRIGEGVEFTKMIRPQVLSSAELEERIEKAVMYHLADAQDVERRINHARLLELAKQHGFTHDRTVGHVFMLSRKTAIDGGKVTDKLQVIYSEDTGWYFQMALAGNNGAVIRGGNVDFVSHARKCDHAEAVAYIAQSSQNYIADMKLKRQEQDGLDLQ